MFIQTLAKDPIYFIWWIGIIVFSVCLHELFHALAAYWQGDDTAKQQGYFSFNPLKHMGTESLVMLVLFGICWGACPVDPAKMRHKYSNAIVSFAGPFANLLLSVGSIVIAVLIHLLPFHFSSENNLLDFLSVAASANAALFLLNMIPLPPLDGAHVVETLVPPMKPLYAQIGSHGFFLLVILMVLPLGFNDLFWDTANSIPISLFQLLKSSIS